MLINIGRTLMIIVWLVMLYNLVLPLATPINVILNFILAFTIFMHLLKLAVFRSAAISSHSPLTTAQQFRLFIFGVFELMAWKKQLSQIPNEKSDH